MIKSGNRVALVIAQLLVALVGFGWLVWIRVPAIVSLSKDSSMWFEQPLEASKLAGVAVTRLDTLPPVAAAICKYLNEHAITEYDLDPRLYDGKDTWYQRTVVGCWPKRLRKGAKNLFVRAAFAADWKACRQKDLADGVVHVVCPD